MKMILLKLPETEAYYLEAHTEDWEFILGSNISTSFDYKLSKLNCDEIFANHEQLEIEVEFVMEAVLDKDGCVILKQI